MKGARLRKKLDDLDAEQEEINKVLQENAVNHIKAVNSVILEPNVTTFLNNSQGKNLKVE